MKCPFQLKGSQVYRWVPIVSNGHSHRTTACFTSMTYTCRTRVHVYRRFIWLDLGTISWWARQCSEVSYCSDRVECFFTVTHCRTNCLVNIAESMVDNLPSTVQRNITVSLGRSSPDWTNNNVQGSLFPILPNSTYYPHW